MIKRNHLSIFISAIAICFAMLSTACAAVETPSFSGIWQSADLELVVMPGGDNPPYTQWARDNITHYNKHYDPVVADTAKVCLLKGMPYTMLLRPRDYPVEIIQTEDYVVMSFELYDTHRIIRIGETRVPESRPISGNGYSIAHWEGNTLVIKTTGMTSLLGPQPDGPYMRSEDAVITESWNLGQHPEHGEVLEVDMVIEDPQIFVEPAKARMVFSRSEPGIAVGGYNCSEALWSDYIYQLEQQLDPKDRRF